MTLATLDYTQPLDTPSLDHIPSQEQAPACAQPPTNLVSIPDPYPLPSNPDLAIPLSSISTPDLAIPLSTIAAQPAQPTQRTSNPGAAIPLSSISAQPLTWLWPQRIPSGTLTLLDGAPGAGTSLLALSIAAAISSDKGSLPDNTPCPHGNVLLISPHDDPAQTIRPRLDAAAGNPDHLFLFSTISPTSPTSPISPTSPTSPISPTSPPSSNHPDLTASPTSPASPPSSISPTSSASPTSSPSPTSAATSPTSPTSPPPEATPVALSTRPFCLADDLDLLEAAILRHHAVLLIIDPLSTALAPSSSSYSRSRRRASTPALLFSLAQLARRTGCAMLLIRHVNPRSSHLRRPHLFGSPEVIATARSGLLLTTAPDDEQTHLLVPAKSSLCASPPILAYQITEDDHGTPLISWLGQYHPARAAASALSAHRQAILHLLQNSPTPLATAEVAANIDRTEDGVRKMLLRMRQDGELTSPSRGHYTTPNHLCLSALTPPTTGTNPKPIPEIRRATLTNLGTLEKTIIEIPTVPSVPFPANHIPCVLNVPTPVNHMPGVANVPSSANHQHIIANIPTVIDSKHPVLSVPTTTLYRHAIATIPNLEKLVHDVLTLSPHEKLIRDIPPVSPCIK